MIFAQMILFLLSFGYRTFSGLSVSKSSLQKKKPTQIMCRLNSPTNKKTDAYNRA